MKKIKLPRLTKAKKKKILFYVLAAIILIFLIVLGIVKYMAYKDPTNHFNFDVVSPEGVFNDLETATPISQQVDR